MHIVFTGTDLSGATEFREKLGSAGYEVTLTTSELSRCPEVLENNPAELVVFNAGSSPGAIVFDTITHIRRKTGCPVLALIPEFSNCLLTRFREADATGFLAGNFTAESLYSETKRCLEAFTGTTDHPFYAGFSGAVINIINQSKEIILLTNNAWEVEYANAKFRQLTGLTDTEISDTPLAEFLSDKQDKHVFETFLTSIEKGENHKVELLFRGKEETDFIEECVVSPLSDTNGLIINYMITGRDISEQKKMQKQQAAFDRIRDFQRTKLARTRTLALLLGHEEDRRRFSNELHEGLGQVLSATRLYLQKIKNVNDENADDFRKIHQLVIDTIKEVRRISSDLSPAELHDFGLHAALNTLVSQLREAVNHVEITLKSDLSRLRFRRNTEINVFRIIQDSINYALRQAETLTLQITLQYEQPHLTVLISNMHKQTFAGEKHSGAEPVATPRWLENTQERAKAVGGNFQVLTNEHNEILLSFDLNTTIIKDENDITGR